jgi:hypothetical protein
LTAGAAAVLVLAGCGDSSQDGTGATEETSSGDAADIRTSDPRTVGSAFLRANGEREGSSACELATEELQQYLVTTIQQAYPEAGDCPQALVSYTEQIPPGQMHQLATIGEKARLKRKGDLVGFVNPDDGTVFLQLEQRQGDWTVAQFPVLVIAPTTG